jgi:hypothetical protein
LLSVFRIEFLLSSLLFSGSLADSILRAFGHYYPVWGHRSDDGDLFAAVGDAVWAVWPNRKVPAIRCMEFIMSRFDIQTMADL